jgi:hypothetical protein
MTDTSAILPKRSLLSPSSSAKWLVCPRSARLEATLPDEISAAAAHGTFAHARFEQKVNAYIRART